MQVTVTNLTAARIYLSDFKMEVDAGKSIVTDRSASDLPRMKHTQQLVADGKVSIVTTPTASETSSGLLTAPASIGAEDAAPVAAATLAAAPFAIRIPIPAGAPAAVVGYALNTLPFKFRILDGKFYCATAGAGGSTLTLQGQAGADALGMTFSSAATGTVQSVGTATPVVVPAATRGLFVLKSDAAAAGEVVLLCRRET